MKKIFKYKLPRDGEIVTISANVVKWLDIQEQDGWPMIWAVVDDAGYESEYEIVAWGTGWEFPDELNHCRYMGTTQDGYGYVWHYFMQEKAKSWSPADSAIATAPVQGVDYWTDWLTTTPATIQDYTVTISCGDADSAISGLTLDKTCTNTTTTIDALQEALERMTAAVVSSNTATLKACT
jgi:hypothetical protein